MEQIMNIYVNDADKIFVASRSSLFLSFLIFLMFIGLCAFFGYSINHVHFNHHKHQEELEKLNDYHKIDDLNLEQENIALELSKIKEKLE